MMAVIYKPFLEVVLEAISYTSAKESRIHCRNQYSII